MSGEWQRRVCADYRSAQQRRNYADETITKRVRVVKQWLAHWGERWVELTWRDVESYGGGRTISASTWRDEISHLSHFYRWAMRNELAPNDPTALVERPRIPKRLPRPATDHDYARIVDDAPAQMFAMLELMAWCGLRCIEVARLRWHDVDLTKRAAMVTGKGSKERVIGLPRRVTRALAAIDASTDHVFVGPRSGRPYHPHRVSQLVAEHCHARGVPITAHQLRHRFATVLLEASEGQIDVVRDALGHSSVATTEIYAKTDMRRVMAVVHLLDRLDEQLFPPPLRLFE